MRDLIIKILIFSTVITSISCHKTIVISNKDSVQKDTKIYEQRLKFYSNDSLYDFIVLSYANGNFKLSHSLHDSLNDRHVSYRLDGIYKDNYIYRDSILQLNSYFPRLIKHDSSFINHYAHLQNVDYKSFYEPEYSYLLSLLEEPNISKFNDKKVIRITPDFDYNKEDNKPQSRYSLRLEINSQNEGKLFLSKGIFDTAGHFNITQKDSCLIKKGDLSQIVEMLNKIDFRKEYIFAERGIDIDEKFLFEFKDNFDYYVLERAFLNKYHNNFQFAIIYSMFLSLKKEYFKN